MCGVAGYLDLELEDPPHVLRRMLSALRHRGPDEQGWFCDRRAGLANARLSIIDLAHGTQPMSAEDDRYWLAYNGELFNFIELRKELEDAGRKFSTQSDTEVVLQALIAWDVDALSRFNGQFGFIFYDRKSGRMMLARDRFGERPLFYARLGAGIAVASEIKALFAIPAVPRALNATAVGRAFHAWTTLPDETCFEGIHQVPPGHVMTFERGAEDVRRYYALPRAAKPKGAREAAEEVRARLDESVRLRLRSDVEVGTYSSGGLDSTITTYLAQQRNTKPVRTFAIGFEDEAYDETPHQDAVAKAFGTQHHTVRIARSQIAEHFPDVITHCETVLFRTAPVPLFLLAKEVTAQGIKVVLTGEGADEAFLGYNIFKETLFRAAFDSISSEERASRVQAMYPYLPHFNEANAAALLRVFAQHKEERVAGLFSHEMRFATAQFATRLLSSPTADALDALSAWIHATPELDARTPLERAQLLEYHTLLQGYLLSSQGDRMSSAFGVEGRCPFLDPEVVALAVSLPEELRLAGGVEEKAILRQAFATALPEQITKRAKQPYRAPDAMAFVNSASPWIREFVQPEALARSGLFDPKKSAAFLQRVMALPEERIGPREDSALVLLLSTQLLHETYVHALPDLYDRKLNLVRTVDLR